MFTCADRGPKGITRNLFVLSRTPTADTNLPETLFQKWQAKLGFADTDTFITHEQESCTYQTSPSVLPSPKECISEVTQSGIENTVESVDVAMETSKEAQHDESRSYCAQTNDPQ